MEELENLMLKLETPAYILDLNRVKENVRKITSSITYPNFQIHYAMFCNDNKELLKFLKELGLGVLILNENEFETALMLGFSKDRIHLTGGTFTKDRLESVLSYGVDVNVDSLRQLELIGEIRQSTNVGLRIKLFGDGVVGAGEGISPQDIEQAKEIAKQSNIGISGLQTYIGTNTLDEQRYLDTIKLLINLRNRFPNIRYLNVGGGFGIPYSFKDRSFDWKTFGEQASNLFEQMGDSKIQFKMEPGRSIVGDAGYFLTRVIEKRNDDTLVVDAPYTNFARPFVYHTNHRVRCLGKNSDKRKFAIRGCSINSKDYLSHKEFTGDIAELPTNIQEGDVLCFSDVGAYSPVMQMDFLHYDRAKTICIENSGQGST